MLKQMKWLPTSKTDETKVLYLRMDLSQPWQLYTAFPEYTVPDYKEPGASRGYATYQRLRREGWTLVKSFDLK